MEDVGSYVNTTVWISCPFYLLWVEFLTVSGCVSVSWIWKISHDDDDGAFNKHTCTTVSFRPPAHPSSAVFSVMLICNHHHNPHLGYGGGDKGWHLLLMLAWHPQLLHLDRLIRHTNGASLSGRWALITPETKETFIPKWLILDIGK